MEERPNNIAAERELLSALLSIPDSINEIDGLQPSDFYNSMNGKVFDAIQKHGQQASLVSKALGEKYWGLIGQLLEIPCPFSVPVMAKSIKDASVKRQLLDQINAISKRAMSSDTAEKTLQYAYQQIQNLMPSVGHDERTVSMRNVYSAERMIAEYEAYLKNLKNNRFTTGIGEIDKRIRGVGGGEVLTILARAGSFKTALLQNLLKNYVAASSWGAILFSLEMPVASITERYFQILDGASGFEVERMFQGGLPPDVLEASRNQFKTDLKRLFIVPSKIGLPQIGEYVKLIESQTGIKIGLVGIDYLGLLDMEGDNEYAQVSAVARGVKWTAKSLNLPIIMLSQVSRKGGDGEVEISLDMGRGLCSRVVAATGGDMQHGRA
jgi:replicative DNA helicase